MAIALLLGSAAAPALAASSSAGNHPHSTAGVSQGKGATPIKYSATYSNSIGGDWTCNGVRVTNKVYPNGFDSFTCTITDLSSMPVGTYTGANFGWNSDKDGMFTTNFSLVVSDNGDGTGTVQGVAYY